MILIYYTKMRDAFSCSKFGINLAKLVCTDKHTYALTYSWRERPTQGAKMSGRKNVQGECPTHVDV